MKVKFDAEGILIQAYRRRKWKRVTWAQIASLADAAEKLTRPYSEVYRLLEALDDVVEANLLGSWFQEPNESFDGLKPIEVIERGEIDRLWNMVYELRSGMPG